VNLELETIDKFMDDITTQFEECLRRHLRSASAINYDAELAKLGMDSMTAVAVLLDMEKTFGIRFPDEMLVEGTFRTAGRLKEAVQLLRERKAS
jgi:acyl carrier protein